MTSSPSLVSLRPWLVSGSEVEGLRLAGMRTNEKAAGGGLPPTAHITTPDAANEVHGQFKTAMRAAGLKPPGGIIADGEIHRFPTNGKRNDASGWYALHLDSVPPAGIFGDWRSGTKQHWRMDLGRELTPAEEEAYQAQAEELSRKRKADEEARRGRARKMATDIWARLVEAPPEHPYLAKKGIKAHGIRLMEATQSLLIPLRDGTEIHSLQYLFPDGSKRFLQDGRVRGCYFSIGKPDKVLCIAEGFATGASIHEATGHAVAVAFSADNLLAVAKAMREKYPDIQLVLCADDDTGTEGNPGLTKATEAAHAAGGCLAIPNFGEDRPEKATDFNDLARHRGAEAVKAAIERAALGLKAVGERVTTVHDFNEQHGVFADGEQFKCATLREEDSDGSLNWVFSSWDQFRHSHAHLKMEVADPKKGIVLSPFIEAWRSDSRRRTFRKLTFSKKPLPADAINTWRGYTVAPAEGTPEKTLGFIREVICSGNEKHYEYFLDVSAAMFQCQRPEERSLISVALLGEEGVGKGTLTAFYESLFYHNNAFITPDSDRIFGRFNEILVGKVFVVADEAFFGGNKAHRGKINALITEKTYSYEIKNGPTGRFPNYVHLWITANPGWTVPAGLNARRFFILNVSDLHRQGYSYFHGLRQAWAAGEKAQFLGLMLGRKFDREVFAAVPKTEGLLDQKLRSLTIYQSFAHQILRNGELIGGTTHGGISQQLKLHSPTIVRSAELLESFRRSVGSSAVGHEHGLSTHIGRVLNALGAHRGRGHYTFQGLLAMREEFDKMIGQPVDWGEALDEAADEPF